MDVSRFQSFHPDEARLCFFQPLTFQFAFRQQGPHKWHRSCMMWQNSITTSNQQTYIRHEPTQQTTNMLSIIFTYICICVYVSLSLSIYLSIYIYIYIERERGIYTHTCIYIYIYIYIHTYTCIYIYIYIYTHIYTHMPCMTRLFERLARAVSRGGGRVLAGRPLLRGLRPFFILRIVRPRIFESKFRNRCANNNDNGRPPLRGLSRPWMNK